MALRTRWLVDSGLQPEGNIPFKLADPCFNSYGLIAMSFADFDERQHQVVFTAIRGRFLFPLVVAAMLASCARAPSPVSDTKVWAGFEKQCRELNTPPGLMLTISTECNIFTIGEPVPVKFTYSIKGPGQVVINLRSYDRSGRLNEIEWTAVGPDGRPTTDPLNCYPGFCGFGGGLGNNATVRENQPTSQQFDANEWIRFDQPGVYEFAVISGLVENGQVASNRIRITTPAGMGGSTDSSGAALSTLIFGCEFSSICRRPFTNTMASGCKTWPSRR